MEATAGCRVEVRMKEWKRPLNSFCILLGILLEVLLHTCGSVGKSRSSSNLNSSSPTGLRLPIVEVTLRFRVFGLRAPVRQIVGSCKISSMKNSSAFQKPETQLLGPGSQNPSTKLRTLHPDKIQTPRTWTCD